MTRVGHGAGYFVFEVWGRRLLTRIASELHDAKALSDVCALIFRQSYIAD